MFCPKCKAEYREEFFRCAECDVDLVYELPAGSQANGEDGAPCDEPRDSVKYKKIYYTHSTAQVMVIKSLFEAHNIRYIVQGEYLRYTGDTLPGSIMVDETQYEEAEELLKDFDDIGGDPEKGTP